MREQQLQQQEQERGLPERFSDELNEKSNSASNCNKSEGYHRVSATSAKKRASAPATKARARAIRQLQRQAQRKEQQCYEQQEQERGLSESLSDERNEKRNSATSNKSTSRERCKREIASGRLRELVLRCARET